MRLVLAQKGADVQDGQADRRGVSLAVSLGVTAGHEVEVQDLGVVSVEGDLVDLGQPLQVAVTDEGVGSQ